MKKTYITPQQHTVNVAPHNPLLYVSQQGQTIMFITIGDDFGTGDEML